MYRCVITKLDGKIILAYLEDDKAIELHLFSDTAYPVGTIFCGRVSKVQKNIDASFVEIGSSSGFLPTISHKCGDLIPVQLVKEGTTLKAPMLTESLSISGQYAVVYQKSGPFKASSKIDAEQKKTLVADMKKLTGITDHAVILRTNAVSADPAVVADEITTLSATLEHIAAHADSRVKSVLYSPGAEWLHVLSGIYRDRLDEIVTDDASIYDEVLTLFPKDIPENEHIAIRLYQDQMLSLSSLYSLRKHIKEAMGKRVWLPCGGFLVIEKTESMVVIDVNSAKIDKKTDKEETFLSVNLEAAEEIARQLRLRNLSGIIIIDFINMKDAKHDALLLSALRNALKADPIRSEIHGFTSLGLVEMTRMKGRKTLYEQAGTVSDDETLSGDKGKI